MDLLFSAIVTIGMIGGWFYLNRFFDKLFKHYSLKRPVMIKWGIGVMLLAVVVMSFFNPLGTATMVTAYFLVICGIFDLIEVLCRKFLPGKKFTRYIHWGGVPAFFVTAIIVYFGVQAGYDVIPVEYEVVIDKEISGGDIKMVYMSDLHIGVTLNAENIGDYCDEIQELNPDIIVIGGDMFDERTTKAELDIACAEIGQLTSKYGTYFTWGNHEGKVHVVEGGVEENVAYVQEQVVENGIHILKDESILIDNRFYLVGRMDEHAGDDLIEAEALMGELDNEKPIIVLEHKPIDVDNMSALGADMYLSGHTHGGQIFPLGFFETFIYDGVYGREEVGDCTMIVSSGMGTWNTPLRIASVSEYLVIDIKSGQ